MSVENNCLSERSIEYKSDLFVDIINRSRLDQLILNKLLDCERVSEKTQEFNLTFTLIMQD